MFPNDATKILTYRWDGTSTPEDLTSNLVTRVRRADARYARQ
jgi:hypothetical protein